MIDPVFALSIFFDLSPAVKVSILIGTAIFFSLWFFRRGRLLWLTLVDSEQF